MKWISVKENLPDETDRYLISDGDTATIATAIVPNKLTFKDEEIKKAGCQWRARIPEEVSPNMTIKYWMRLPEAPNDND
jgi:hypothetical protein